jgi:TolA-binding protein
MSVKRKDIFNYLNSEDPEYRNSIERSALEHEFDNAALDGWDEFPHASMKRLDQRFNKKNYWLVKIAIVAVLISTTIYIALNFTQKAELVNPTQTANVQEKGKTVLLEKTDYIIPEPIKKMEELPAKKQIQASTIINDFREKTAIEETKFNQDIKIQLPIKKLDSDNSESRTLIKETSLGKELYLYDLKVIDYRIYRAKPEINTKQTLLTGTPANVGDLPEETSLEWENIEVPYIEYLSKSMEYFSKGQNKRALTRFLEILNTYPDDLNANFYAGLCYYNLKAYNSAISHFDNCSNSDFINFYEEQEWYKAKCYLANNQKEEAKVLLKQIVAEKGFYANQASKILLQN